MKTGSQEANGNPGSGGGISRFVQPVKMGRHGPCRRRAIRSPTGSVPGQFRVWRSGWWAG